MEKAVKILEKIKIRFAHLRILRTHYEEIVDIPEHTVHQIFPDFDKFHLYLALPSPKAARL